MRETFGFTDVTNVKGGFGGARDQMGRTVAPGWAESDLPVATEQTPGASYQALLARADAAE